MVSYCPRCLVDLCAIRVAYLMWTRQDMYNRKDLRVLACGLSNDVKRLPLDISCMSLIVKRLEFTGRQMIPLFTVWLSKTKILGYFQIRTFRNLLYESLVLKFDGLINQRETAEKILASRILRNEFAFRLACVNFLQREVSILWHVDDNYLERFILNEETDEVLFWICYHLSQHESVPSVGYEETGQLAFFYCYNYAIETGNTSFFDFEQKFPVKCYGNVFLIRCTVRNNDEGPVLDFHQACAIFHLKLLNLEELKRIFHVYPSKITYIYLHLPMSQTFIENVEEIWEIIPDNDKDDVFVKIFSFLFGKNEKLMYEYNFQPIPIPIGNHSFEHLRQLWNSLWKISSDSYKLKVLNEHVFKSIEIYVVRSLFLEEFNNSILKKNLVTLFLSNEKAIFELYTRPNLKDSLIRLIKKHLPDDFKELRYRYFKKTAIKKKKRYPYPSSIFIPSLTSHPDRKHLLDLYKKTLSYFEDE